MGDSEGISVGTMDGISDHATGKREGMSEGGADGTKDGISDGSCAMAIGRNHNHNISINLNPCKADKGIVKQSYKRKDAEAINEGTLTKMAKASVESTRFLETGRRVI